MNNDLKVIFGNNVKKYRKEQGLSQEELASLCNLHRTYISDIERKKRNISLNNVQKIANALNIDAYYLLIDDNQD